MHLNFHIYQSVLPKKQFPDEKPCFDGGPVQPNENTGVRVMLGDPQNTLSYFCLKGFDNTVVRVRENPDITSIQHGRNNKSVE